MSLVVKSISKKHKNENVLDNISVQFEQGKIYGLLGRNGAGKSTLLNIINNRSFATSGEVLLNGIPVADSEVALNQLYLMSEYHLFPSFFKIKELFKITERFYGTFDWALADEMLHTFGLNADQRFKKLSTGYRTITKLIIALSVPCEYIFLDEPVLGLDATHREIFYSYLIEVYQQRFCTFVISTHLIEEIATILEEVIILSEGKLLQAAPVETILQHARTVSGPKELVRSYIETLQVLGQKPLGGFLTAYVYGRLPEKPIEGISILPSTLQEYFIQLTSGEEE